MFAPWSEAARRNLQFCLVAGNLRVTIARCVSMEGGGGPGAEEGVNHFDRLPEGALDEIFRRMPHLSRLHCRCVCSRWNRLLRSQQEHHDHKPGPGPRPVGCLAMLLSHDQERVEGFFFAPDERDAGTRLGVTFPPGWRPETNAGGFRATRDLAAFFLDGHYWVGNPVHDKWEKVPEPVQSSPLRFDKRRFELVVDKDGHRYQIVQFRMNESVDSSEAAGADVRERENWVIEVYCSRTRLWRAGAVLDRLVFRRLCDFCVLDRSVYFLGRPGGTSVANPGELGQVEVWGYHLDSDTLAVVLSAADYTSSFPPGFATQPSSIRLHVSRQPDGKLEFSITQVASLMVRLSPADDMSHKLFRLLLDQHNSERRSWCVDSMVDVDEFTTSGPQAALVADTWGLGVVAYYADTFDNLDVDPVDRIVRFFLYQRDIDEQKWVEWEVLGTGTSDKEDMPAIVAFQPCECLEFDY